MARSGYLHPPRLSGFRPGPLAVLARRPAALRRRFGALPGPARRRRPAAGRVAGRARARTRRVRRAARRRLPQPRVRAVAAPRRARAASPPSACCWSRRRRRRASRTCSRRSSPPGRRRWTTHGWCARTNDPYCPEGAANVYPGLPTDLLPGQGHINPERRLRPVAGGGGVGARSRDATSRHESRDQLADRARVAVRQPGVRAVEELARVLHAQLGRARPRRPAPRGPGSTRRCCPTRCGCGASSAARRRGAAPSAPGPSPPTAPRCRRSAGRWRRTGSARAPDWPGRASRPPRSRTARAAGSTPTSAGPCVRARSKNVSHEPSNSSRSWRARTGNSGR